MKGYVERALKELKFIQTRTKPTYGPTPYTPPEYSKKIQYAIRDLSPDLDPEAVNYIEQVTGKFGYPARSIDSTMQHALNDLTMAATKGTKQTMKELIHFLNYCATNSDASIIFQRSNMILTLDSDAAYLNAPRVDQGMFRVYWGPGKENLADYYTTRFAASHHKNDRPIYLYDKDRSPNMLQGCVRILAAPAKSPPLRTIQNNATKPANMPLTRLTNLERLYNSRPRLPAAAAAMVRLVNRLSNSHAHN